MLAKSPAKEIRSGSKPSAPISSPKRSLSTFSSGKTPEKLMPVDTSASFEDTWQPVMAGAAQEQRETIMMSISGLPKHGKTHLAFTAVDFEGFEGVFVKLPPGAPVYCIGTENTSIIEKGNNFADKPVFVQEVKALDSQGKVDWVESIRNFEKFLSGLSGVKVGTLVIDNWSDINDWLYYINVEFVLGIGFDQFGQPNRAVTPTEHKWREKEGKKYLTMMRGLSTMVVLVNRVKPEYVKKEGESGPFAFQPTGELVNEGTKGSEYFYDMDFRIQKAIEVDEETGQQVYYRRGWVIGSRWEKKEVTLDRTRFRNPTYSDIIESIKPYL